MTIKDIARMSGCGVSTVSRVLNGHRDVSDETRRRVLAVVEEQNFRPNANAKRLKQRGDRRVAVLVKGRRNLLFADLVERIQRCLAQRGQDTALYYLDEEEDEAACARQLCREHSPLGFLFLGGDLECFRRSFGEIQAPGVLLTNGAEELGFANLSSLTIDDEEAARQAICHLAEHGHRHIGVLGGNPSDTQISHRRMMGCQRAFEELGLPFDPERQWESCRYSLSEAYEATKRLFRRAPQLTAVFAMSDVMALGCMRALADQGKQVPRDISVVGYDGVILSRYCIPRLTTVYQDTQALAEQGVELLLKQSAGSLSGPVHQTLPFRLLQGESVAVPGSGGHEAERGCVQK